MESHGDDTYTYTYTYIYTPWLIIGESALASKVVAQRVAVLSLLSHVCVAYQHTTHVQLSDCVDNEEVVLSFFWCMGDCEPISWLEDDPWCSELSLPPYPLEAGPLSFIKMNYYHWTGGAVYSHWPLVLVLVPIVLTRYCCRPLLVSASFRNSSSIDPSVVQRSQTPKSGSRAKTKLSMTLKTVEHNC